MHNRLALLTVALVTLATSNLARAETYIGPGIGIAFGNPSAKGLADFVLDACWLSPEPVGLEFDAMYAPSFFGSQGPYGANSVTTAMGNVVLAAREIGPAGRYRHRSARPFVSGGLGLIHEATTAPSISKNDLGTNLGVGVMATSGQVGVRADLRYFRDLVGSSEGNTTSIDFGSFHFWRTSITVLFRF